ncbi:MAG: amidohydrolase [Pseudomonadota bacterium]|nr:amidohydrolase [Pseudomonadota bacterium]
MVVLLALMFSQLSFSSENLFKLYKDLHANPELSWSEEKTSARMAEELKKIGFEVTTQVGKRGVVGVLKNGKGPTLLIRTDMDALPVEENTGFSFASRVKAKNSKGEEVSVMHACGHDIHMTVFIGTAQIMMNSKSQWKGTLVMMAQPAEELGQGATAMLKDGLFKKFPTPQFALALHVKSDAKAGHIAYRSGFAMANVDSIDITVKGIGGHGAYPHKTKDPIVLASQIVLALQTIVSREVSPLDNAVVTVGAIHAGTKNNIIPDSAHLKITVRTYKDEVRSHILKSIKRITFGLSEAAGIPKELEPEIKESEEYTPATYNDPGLMNRIVLSFKKVMPEKNIFETEPVMGGEDFGQLGRTEPKIPIAMFMLGAAPHKMYEEYHKKKQPLPSLHSSTFTPDWETAIPAGVKAMTAAALDLLQ